MKYAGLSAEELVRLCAESCDAEAWEEFVRRFQRTISLAVRRTISHYQPPTQDVIEDLTQNTFFKVLANNRRVLRDFKPQRPDAFYGLLKVMAANLVRDHFRVVDTDKRPKIANVDWSEVAPLIPDGNASGAGRIEREILLREIDGILISNKAPTAIRDRHLFWLHHRQGFTAVEIARISSFGLSVKGVEAALLRLKRMICQFLVERSDPADTLMPSGTCPEEGAEILESSENEKGNPAQNPLTRGEGQT